jgi:AAA domain-containing protein
MNLKEFWTASISAGFFPLSIEKGTKKPIGLWSENTHPTPEPHPDAGAVGLRCLPRDGISGIDTDCTCLASQTYLDTFRRELGPVPVRWGRRPKFLIPFRCEGAAGGKSFVLPCGCKLQIIAGQFVAWGEHPDTHQPYVWDDFAAPWPTLNQITLYALLSYVGINATAESKDYVSETELRELSPRDDSERQLIRDFASGELKRLVETISGKIEGRGSPIFASTTALRPALIWDIITVHDIENAIFAAGFSLDEKSGGRTLGEEIMRGAGITGILISNLILTSLKARRSLIDHVSNTGTLPGCITTREMSETHYPRLKHTVDGLIPEGLIIFTARGKIGKSYIMLSAGLAVLEGGMFWGHQAMAGDVLMYGFEDTAAQFWERHQQLRPNGITYKNKLLCFLEDSEPQVPRVSLKPGVFDFCAHLETVLKTHPQIKLVVIDPIVNIRADQTDKTKSLYQTDYDNLRGIKKIASKYGVTIIGVHHANKQSEVSDASDIVSGSTGLVAVSDGAWMMFADKERQTADLITQMKRIDSTKFPLAMHRLPQGGIEWLPVEGTRDVLTGTEIERRIQAAIVAAGCEATAMDIMLRSPGMNENTLRRYLRRMCEPLRGMLKHTDRGLYVIPGSTPKTRPEGARDILLAAATNGTYPDFQAGKIVDIVHVLPHLQNNDRCPVVEGCAVALDAAKGLLRNFHDPAGAIRDMMHRQLAYVFDKVLLIPNQKKFPWDSA